MKTVAPQINGVRVFFTGRIACSRRSDNGEGRGSWDRALKWAEIPPIFSRFNPWQSLPYLATDDRRQFQYLNKVLSNKTWPLVLESNWCKLFSFLWKERANSVAKNFPCGLEMRRRASVRKQTETSASSPVPSKNRVFHLWWSYECRGNRKCSDINKPLSSLNNLWQRNDHRLL